MLTGQVERLGICVLYGKPVVEYYEKPEIGKAGMVLGSRETIAADLVIAPYGIGSKSRKIVSCREVLARSTGYAIYRTAFPIAIAIADPIIREQFTLMPDGRSSAEMRMW